MIQYNSLLEHSVLSRNNISRYSVSTGFVPDTDPLAFGFLDPSLVVHATHLIPMFNDGRTAELLAASLTAGQPPDETDDWVSFFVSMCVFQLVHIDGIYK